MARIRSIKPEFCVSEQLAECSTNARLVFALMWMFCDDQGIHPAKVRTLKGEIFPLDDRITVAEVGQWIGELVAQGLLLEYEVGSERYWMVTGWKRHQKIDKPSRKHPLPLAEHSPSPPRILAEPSPPEGKGGESKGEEPKTPQERSSPGDSGTARVPTPARASPPPEPPSPPVAFPPPDDQRATTLHGLCCAAGVRVSVLDARQWVSEGVTEDQLRAALQRGEQRKNGTALNRGFLQLMLQDVRAGPAGYDAEAVIAQAIANIAAKEAANASH